MKLEIGSKTRKKVGDFIADEKLTAVVFADVNFTQEHEKKQPHNFDLWGG